MLAPLAAWVTRAHAIRPTHMGLASMHVRFRFWDLHRRRLGPVNSNRGWRMRPIIMVVDDELDILDIVVQLLEGEGYAVVAFSDGHAALDYARHHPPALALVDLLMPLMDGRELIARLRAEVGSDLPIIVMSASTNRNRVYDLPIQEYVGKPFDLDDLLGHVNRLIDSPAHAPRRRRALEH